MLLAALLPSLLLLPLTPSDGVRGVALGGLLLLTALQVWRERWRWQMAPTYILTTLVGMLLALAPPLAAGLHAAVTGVLLLGWLGALGVVWHFPIFRLPRPSGPYAVGTTRFDVEIGSRRVAVQAWYPAIAPSRRPSPYLPKAPFPLDWLGLVPTPAYAEAVFAPSAALAPVLLYGHGEGLLAVANTRLMLHLASHGYAVFSISHPGQSAVVVYTDGPPQRRPWRETWQALRQPYLGDDRPAIRQIERRVADMVGVMDSLRVRNVGALFQGQLDLGRCGTLGHGTGGRVALRVGRQDRRVQAVFNLDGALGADATTTTLPYLAVGSVACPDAMWVIRGVTHLGLTDAACWLRGPRRWRGTLDPTRAATLVNDMALAFFDQHLRGIHSARPQDAALTQRARRG